LSKYGGNNNFRETEGKCTETGKIYGGEIRNVWLMTKKSHQKFWWMKMGKIFGKRQILKIFLRV